MVELKTLVEWCDARTNRNGIRDFPGSRNGLQLENGGQVKKIGAAVDAGQGPFESAIAAGIDFLIVHHGMYWVPPEPLTGVNYEKVKTAIAGGLAVYGSHLPLDCHPEIGNNALVADELGLTKTASFLNYEGNDIGLVTTWGDDRTQLSSRLRERFPTAFSAIEFGPAAPRRIGILTGSGTSAVPELKKNGIDTLITGELKQHCFNIAQEDELNLYCCGHYATEVFGVRALAAEAAEEYGLEWEFIGTGCPL